MNHAVSFFPSVSTNITIGGGGAGTFSNEVDTGALTGGVEKSIAHGLTGYTHYEFKVYDDVNLNYVDVNKIGIDPLDATKFVILTGTDVAAGYKVQINAY